MEHCCKYASPVHFNGQGGAQMCGGRLWVKSICCIYGMENCYSDKLKILVNMLAN